MYPSVFSSIRTSCWETETPVTAIIFSFVLREMIEESFLYHSPQVGRDNIGFWHLARIRVSFSVPELSEECGMTDLKEFVIRLHCSVKTISYRQLFYNL